MPLTLDIPLLIDHTRSQFTYFGPIVGLFTDDLFAQWRTVVSFELWICIDRMMDLILCVCVPFSICLLFLSHFSQCKRRKATPACKMRQSKSLTHYRRWKLCQTQCPSFRASYRHVKICGRSEMKCTVSWSNKPITCLSPTALPTVHTGICSPAWPAPSCPAAASSDTSGSTWKGVVATPWIWHLLSHC